MKKCDRDDEVESERPKEKGDSGETEKKWEKSGGHTKPKEAKDKCGFSLCCRLKFLCKCDSSHIILKIEVKNNCPFVGFYCAVEFR